MPRHENRFRLVLLRGNRRAVPARSSLPRVEFLEGRAVPALNFTSAIGVGGNAFDVEQVALDAAGDTYLTGGFSGSVNFNTGSNPPSVLDGGGETNGFVAKYSPSDALIWVREFAADPTVSGSLCDVGGVAVASGSGTVYVAGAFAGSVDFNASGSTPDPVTSTGSNDGFLLALTSDGGFDPNRLRTFGGPEFDSARIVKLSPDGTNVYVSGAYSGTVNFDPGGTNTTLIDPFTDGTDTYVMKLASTFTSTTGFGFVRGIAQTGAETDDLNADSAGNVYVVGGIAGTSVQDAFLAKVDSNGTLVAVKDFAGPASGGISGYATGVVIDSLGNVYVSGVFAGTGVNFATNFGPGDVDLDSAGNEDGFLIKLDPSFTLQWARRIGSVGVDRVTDLTIDANNVLYLCGYESGPTTFGGPGAGTAILANPTGQEDAFVVEVDSDGNFLQGVSASGTGPSTPNSIAVNGFGQIAIDGLYNPDVTFGGVSLGSQGSYDFFLASLSNSATPTPAPTSTPTPTPPPTFTDVVRLTTGKGRKKKVTGFEINFSSALDATVAGSVAHYRVTQPGRTKHSPPKVIAVKAAEPEAAGSAVTLILGAYTAGKPLTLTATGLTGTGGAAIATIVTKL